MLDQCPPAYHAVTPKGRKKASEHRAKMEETKLSIDSLCKEVAALEAELAIRNAGRMKLMCLKEQEVVDLTCDDVSEPKIAF